MVRDGEIDWVFPSPIGRYQIEANDLQIQSAIKEAYALRRKKEGNEQSNMGGDQIWIDSDPEAPTLNQMVIQAATHCGDFAPKIGIMQDLELKNAWVNINGTSSWNATHTHFADLSCCLYLKVPKPESNIGFVRSDGIYSPALMQATGDTVKITPRVRDVLIFPSHLMHFVEPNLSKQDRISVAFNVFVKVPQTNRI